MMRLQIEVNCFLAKIAARTTIPFALVLLVGVTGMLPTGFADESMGNPENDPQFIRSGSLVICGGGILPSHLIERFIELGGGRNAHVVIVSTASIYADSDFKARHSVWYDRLAEHEVASVEILHTRSRADADNPEFSKMLETATAVWFVGGNQNWVTESFLATKTEERFHAVLARGGVIGGTSAGAAIMSRCMIADGRGEPHMSTGLGFLPGTIVDQHFRKRKRLDRLTRALELRPGMVGIGVDEGTALIVHGRTLEVIGDSDVQICMSPSGQQPGFCEPLPVGKKADIVALRRAALARADMTVAGNPSGIPDLLNGTLVIAGGGATPTEAISSFLSAAGGVESPIVVVSNDASDMPPEQNDVCSWLNKAGARNVQMMHATTREDLTDPRLIALLKEARGVWFTGGRPWGLVDTYLDTNFADLFHDVLRRGGVIGGSSAGATIQGEYLVDGDKSGGKEILQVGYDRGFRFLPGVAIEQSFTRDRIEDLAQLKKAHPDVIGLGVEQSTALIVRGSTMQVVGEHQVTIFDRHADASTESPEYAILKSGERYDLRHHRRMIQAAVDSVTK